MISFFNAKDKTINFKLHYINHAMQDWPKKSKRQRRLLKSEDDDSLFSIEHIAYNYTPHLYEISTVIA